MLEKHSSNAIAAIALASLVMLSFQLGSTPAYSEEFDEFGIEKIYPTIRGGNEWYVNMDDPTSGLENIDNVQFSQNGDGSWRVSADQIRMEAWSPSNEKWLNVEITEYAKIESGSNELLQMYSRGGHHTSRDECLGSAYKARLYGDGRAAWNKEVTHPAYAGNRAVNQVTTEALEDRWIGFKAVIYNFERDGNTYVRLESYVDDDVTDENGNLVVRNNWKLASVYEDRGGWATNDDDFDSSCGRERDEILTQPGGTDTQNIAAWRSDDLSWSFKYLSVREIDPTAEQPEQPIEELPQNDDEETLPPVEEPAPEAPNAYDGDLCCELITSQHITNDGSSPEVNSVELGLKKVLSRTAGTITVAIVQNDEIVGRYELKTSALETTYRTITATFESVNVTGEFDVVVLFDGSGVVAGYITQVN